MRYEFKSLKSGRPCCTTDDIRHLCPNCLSQAVAALEAAARGSMSALTAAPPPPPPSPAPACDCPEPPPSLAVAVGGREVPYAPVYGGGPRPRPTVAAAGAAVDDPPSLTEMIRNRRNNR